MGYRRFFAAFDCSHVGRIENNTVVFRIAPMFLRGLLGAQISKPTMVAGPCFAAATGGDLSDMISPPLLIFEPDSSRLLTPEVFWICCFSPGSEVVDFDCRNSPSPSHHPHEQARDKVEGFRP
jgi:hypothetical protein